MINVLCSRERVKGFLRVDGRSIVNGAGDKILLQGPGLGNWLLPEGYMWLFTDDGKCKRADRPRRIEAFIEELTGKDYCIRFWKTFRDTYITENDIREIAQIGFNSLRLPINYRILMKDGESTELLEDGFTLIDRLLDWCQRHKIYVFFDMHGAPGGQTGANIDDCIDDKPRLFIDAHQYEKGLILWEAIAKRYKDRWIVAGYDLLNEPLSPGHFEHIDKLVAFYADCVERIRAIDKLHMLSIEGMNWATDVQVFSRRYDDNMLIHFHRYWCTPDDAMFSEFLDVSEKLNLPLWLGESGENSLDWYNAVFPNAIKHGISWNFWPWKRMKTDKPTLCEISAPEGWDKITAYLKGGMHPGYDAARGIFDAYLQNVLIENISIRKDVASALLGYPVA